MENDSSEFFDVAEVTGSSVHIADADIVVVINGDQGKVIKHRDRLPEEVDVMVARRPLSERLGDSPEQRIMDER